MFGGVGDLRAHVSHLADEHGVKEIGALHSSQGGGAAVLQGEWKEAIDAAFYGFSGKHFFYLLGYMTCLEPAALEKCASN